MIMGQPTQCTPHLGKARDQASSLPNPSGKTREPTLRWMLKRRARKYPELISPNLSKKESGPPRIKWSKPEDKRSHSHPARTSNCRSGNILCTPSQGLSTYKRRQSYPVIPRKAPQIPEDEQQPQISNTQGIRENDHAQKVE